MRGPLAVLAILLLLTAALPTAAPQLPTEYTPRPPILIEGDEALTPENGVTRGSGTADDPYVIEGWIISAFLYPMPSGAVRLHNVSAHVVIQQNFLSAILPGSEGHGEVVWIEMSSNITIRENQIEATNNGIFLNQSRYITVEGNYVQGHFDSQHLIWNVRAIQTLQSSGSVIRNNIIIGYSSGIAVQRDSHHIEVRHNAIRGGGPYGGIDLHKAHNVTVAENEIYDNNRAAIQFFATDNSTIEKNLMENVNLGLWGDQSPWYTQQNQNVLLTRNVVNGSYRPLAIECTACEVSRSAFLNGQLYGHISGAGGTFSLNNNTFLGHTDGFAWLGPNVTAHHNNFIAPPDTVIRSAFPIDFRHNWWDDPSGPAEGMLADTVRYEPWLTEPSPGAPSP